MKYVTIKKREAETCVSDENDVTKKIVLVSVIDMLAHVCTGNSKAADIRCFIT